MSWHEDWKYTQIPKGTRHLNGGDVFQCLWNVMVSVWPPALGAPDCCRLEECVLRGDQSVIALGWNHSVIFMCQCRIVRGGALDQNNSWCNSLRWFWLPERAGTRGENELIWFWALLLSWHSCGSHAQLTTDFLITFISKSGQTFRRRGLVQAWPISWLSVPGTAVVVAGCPSPVTTALPGRWHAWH